MAYTKIVFENPKTGQIKEAPVGFSWTVLFFGCIPPIFRGDYKWALIMLICAVCSLGLSGFVFIFIYNKLYIKELISNGFKAKSIGKGTLEQATANLGIEIPLWGQYTPKPTKETWGEFMDRAKGNGISPTRQEALDRENEQGSTA
jgi:hypothetical protein